MVGLDLHPGTSLPFVHPASNCLACDCIRFKLVHVLLKRGACRICGMFEFCKKGCPFLALSTLWLKRIKISQKATGSGCPTSRPVLSHHIISLQQRDAQGTCKRDTERDTQRCAVSQPECPMSHPSPHVAPKRRTQGVCEACVQ